MKYVEEELTLAEFSEKFLGNNDFETPTIFDLSDYDIEVLGKDFETKKDVYKPLKSFIVKEKVDKYYTDDSLKCSGNHRIIDDKGCVEYQLGFGSLKTNEIPAKNHPDFRLVNKPLNIVDVEVEDIENYYANGRLNHNTTSGGKGLPFHASVRVRLKTMGQIKQKIGAIERTIGIKIRAQVIKSRVGPPYRIADFDMYFDRGIYDYETWLNILKDNDLVFRSNPGFKIIDHKGEERRFETKDWGELLENDLELKEFLYKKICDFQIMKYRNDADIGLSTEDIVVTDEVLGDD